MAKQRKQHVETQSSRRIVHRCPECKARRKESLAMRKAHAEATGKNLPMTDVECEKCQIEYRTVGVKVDKSCPISKPFKRVVLDKNNKPELDVYGNPITVEHRATRIKVRRRNGERETIVHDFVTEKKRAKRKARKMRQKAKKAGKSARKQGKKLAFFMADLGKDYHGLIDLSDRGRMTQGQAKKILEQDYLSGAFNVRCHKIWIIPGSEVAI